MRKTIDVIGLPVLDVSSGKKIGSIKDVFFNEHGELMGLAVESNGLFKKLHYIAFNNIGAIGDDAVTVGTDRFLTSIDQGNVFNGLLSGKQAFKGLPVITANGNELGHIEDVYFMEEMGRIIGYELSDGFFEDFTEGRRIIKYPQKSIIGEDAMIVPQSEIEDVSLEY